MPRTLLPKPTPGAGPSDDGGGLSSALSQRQLVQLRAQFDLDPKEMPKFGEKRMSFGDFLVVYAGWHLSWDSGTVLVTKLEDPKLNDKMSKVLNALTQEVKWTLTDRVDGLFRELLKDTKVNAIHLKLIGLTGRLTSLHFGNGGPTRPSVGQQHLDDVQVYHLHALTNWMKDSERKNITIYHTLGVFNTHYEFSIVPQNFFVFNNITDKNHNLHKLVAARIMDPTHRALFGKKAFDSYKEYTEKNKLSEPLLVIPGVSQDELESITNTNYDALITAATGSTSRQTIGVGPSQATESNTPEPDPFSDLFSYNLAREPTPFDEFFDYNLYKTRNTEAPPAPSGSGSNEGSGKGKGRARESSSSSPGDKGKGKGKKPRQ